MKNVLIIGASGGIARILIDLLQNIKDMNLTLFLCNTNNIKNIDISKYHII